MKSYSGNNSIFSIYEKMVYRGSVNKLLNDLFNTNLTKLVWFFNFHLYNNIKNESVLENAMPKLNVLCRDGIATRIMEKILSFSRSENLNGTEVIPLIIERAIYKGYKVVLIGASEENSTLASNAVESNFGVKVYRYNGYHDINYYLTCTKHLSEQKCLVIIGMGMPLQESLSLKLSSNLNQSIIVCGGAIIDRLAGKVPRAPSFMVRWGFEWLYRLLNEPKRLASRVLLGFPLFLFDVFKEKIHRI